MQLNTASLCPAPLLRNWSCSRCNATLLPSNMSVVQADHDQLLALVGVASEPLQ